MTMGENLEGQGEVLTLRNTADYAGWGCGKNPVIMHRSLVHSFHIPPFAQSTRNPYITRRLAVDSSYPATHTFPNDLELISRYRRV
jgi:hypothetical protein